MSTIKLITPVGTSLFDNYFNNDINRDYPHKGAETIYNKLKDNDIRFRLFESQLREYQQSLKNDKEEEEGIGLLGSQVAQNWAFHNDKASAEIASILEIKRTKYADVDIDVYLIATDSITSPLAATIIKHRFVKHELMGVKVHFEVDQDVIPGLQVENEEEFKDQGLKNLLNRINNIATEPHITSFEDIAFNITGGYKAVLPYLAILGQIEGSPLLYIFEDLAEKASSALIEIPKLPVDFDFSMIEDNHAAFEQLYAQRSLAQSKFKQLLNVAKKEREEEYKRLEKNYRLLQCNNGQVQLAFWGDLLFLRYEKLLGSGNQRQANLRGHLVELKLYEHYVKQCLRNNKGIERLIEINPNHKIGDIGEKRFEIDLYIETDESITAIEIKPGGNIPFDVIKDKLKIGGFKYLLQHNNGKKVNLEVVLYSSSKNIPENLKRQIQELHSDERYKEETQNLKWYWLGLPSNYQRNVDWQVKNRLTLIDY